MKRVFALLALVSALGLIAPTVAQDKPVAPPTTSTTVTETIKADTKAGTVTETIKVEEKKAEATAAPAPQPNKGDVAWMLTSTALVLMMSIPALALFYGGMVCSKNALSMLMQVFVVFSLVTVLWCIYGYSLASPAGTAYFGGSHRL